MTKELSIPDVVGLLVERGWQQQDIAARCGVSPSAVTLWKKGKYQRIDHDSILVLADMAGVAAGPLLRQAGYNTANIPIDNLIPEVVELLRDMTPEEQRRLALPAIRAALRRAQELRGTSR